MKTLNIQEKRISKIQSAKDKFSEMKELYQGSVSTMKSLAKVNNNGDKVGIKALKENTKNPFKQFLEARDKIKQSLKKQK